MNSAVPLDTASRLRRHPDWPERLAAYIQGCRHLPFGWGWNDCSLFAADGVRCMTGVDFAAAWRHTYSTEAQALEIMAAHGGVRGLASAAWGEPTDEVVTLQRGDVVLARLGDTDMLGLVAGGAQWCAPGTHGLFFAGMRAVQCGWRI